MSTMIRFPFNRPIPNVGPAELSQIITILPATATIERGGAQAYADVRPWKQAGPLTTEAPYTCVVIEMSATAALTIGNGTTEMIGLYGQIDLAANPANAAQRKRTLIGILGLPLGAQMPQIPIVQQAAAALDLVGFSQVFSNIAAYDRLSVGGVFGDVAVPVENETLTVVARPIRRRDYLG
jgi:hypothetical protein